MRRSVVDQFRSCLKGLEDSGADISDRDAALIGLGLALKARDPRGALEYFGRARSTPGGEHIVKALTEMGHCYISLGEPKECARCWREALAIDPTDVPLRFNLGVVLAEEDETDEAIKCYTEALNREPDFTQAIHNLASLRIQRREYDLATDLLKTLIEKSPDDPSVPMMLGGACAGRGDFDTGRRLLETGIKTHPSFARTYLLLSALELEVGDTHAAAAALDKCEARCSPSDEQREEIREKREQVAALERGDANDEKSPPPADSPPERADDALYEGLDEVRSLAEQGEMEAALQMVRELEADYPQADQLLLTRSSILANLGRKDEAKLAARSYLDTHPGDPSAVGLLVSLADEAEQESLYTSVLQSLDSPDAPQLSYLLALKIAAERDDVQAQRRIADTLRRVHPEFLAELPVRLALATVNSDDASYAETAKVLSQSDGVKEFEWISHVGRLDAFLHESAIDNVVAECDWLVEHTKDDTEPYRVRDFLKTKAEVLCHVGRYEEALAPLERLLNLTPDDAWVYSQLGECCLATGRLDYALKLLTEATHRDPDDHVAHWNLGNLYHISGRNDGALFYWQRAAGLSERKGDKETMARLMQNLGGLWETLGHPDLATRRLREAASLFRELDIPVDAAWAEMTLAGVESHRGNRARAREIYETCVRVFEELGEKRHLCTALMNMVATLDDSDAKPAYIEGLYKRALRISIDDEDDEMANMAGLALGRFYLQNAEYEKAQAQFADCLGYFSGLRNRQFYLPDLYLLSARALEGLKRTTDAEKSYQQSLASFEQNLVGLRGEDARGGVLGSYARAVGSYVSFLCRTGRELRGFEYFDGIKSRMYREFASGYYSTGAGPLSSKFGDVRFGVRAASPIRETAETDSELEQTELHLMEARALDNIILSEPAKEPEASRISMEDIRLALGGERSEIQIVEYSLTGDDAFAFVVEPNGRFPTCVRLPAQRDKIEMHAREFRSSILNRGPDAAKQASALGELLIRPLMKYLDKRRVLVFIPDGVLHQIPLHALVVQDRFVGEHFQVIYSPSSYQLGETCRRKAAGTGFAIFGDPAVEDFPLQYAGLEARLLGALAGTVAFVGQDATCESVEGGLKKGRFVHVACHGLFRENRVLTSGLVLSDGILTGDRITSIGTSADLVTLSACDTGVGTIRWGDEVVGLVRALLLAGARSVMSTLWQIDDLPTTLLMCDFYKRYAIDGKLKSFALQAAQECLRNTTAANLILFLQNSLTELGPGCDGALRKRILEDITREYVLLGETSEARRHLEAANGAAGMSVLQNLSDLSLTCLGEIARTEGQEKQHKAVLREISKRGGQSPDGDSRLPSASSIEIETGRLKRTDKPFGDIYFWAPFHIVGAP